MSIGHIDNQGRLLVTREAGNPVVSTESCPECCEGLPCGVELSEFVCIPSGSAGSYQVLVSGSGRSENGEEGTNTLSLSDSGTANLDPIDGCSAFGGQVSVFPSPSLGSFASLNGFGQINNLRVVSAATVQSQTTESLPLSTGNLMACEIVANARTTGVSYVAQTTVRVRLFILPDGTPWISQPPPATGTSIAFQGLDSYALGFQVLRAGTHEYLSSGNPATSTLSSSISVSGSCNAIGVTINSTAEIDAGSAIPRQDETTSTTLSATFNLIDVLISNPFFGALL